MATNKKTAARKKPPVKKTTVKKTDAPTRRSGRPVRLDLTETDHGRLQAAADRVGLGKAAYARQAVLERVRRDETAALGGV